MQHEYGIGVSGLVSGDLTFRRLRGLVAGLPTDGTALWRKARQNPAPGRKAVAPPDSWWSPERDLLAGLTDAVNVLVWLHTDDARKGRGHNRPKPISRPGIAGEGKRFGKTSLPRAEVERILRSVGPPRLGGPGLDPGDEEHRQVDDADQPEDHPGDGEATA